MREGWFSTLICTGLVVWVAGVYRHAVRPVLLSITRISHHWLGSQFSTRRDGAQVRPSSSDDSASPAVWRTMPPRPPGLEAIVSDVYSSIVSVAPERSSWMFAITTGPTIGP